jgi:hypothetical protein
MPDYNPIHRKGRSQFQAEPRKNAQEPIQINE